MLSSLGIDFFRGVELLEKYLVGKVNWKKKESGGVRRERYQREIATW